MPSFRQSTESKTMQPLPLEDLAEDIISKAQRGLEIPTEDLAELAGLDKSVVIAARKGNEVRREDILAIAKPLQLSPEKLAAIWAGTWYPEEPSINNLVRINTPFYDMSVNAYLYIKNNKALLFDTGVDAKPVLEHLEKNKIDLSALLITHTHRDHIEALESILIGTDCETIFSPHKEFLPNTQKILENETLEIEGFPKIIALETSGHCIGGLSYYIMEENICFVGDSIFAGSMGGGMISYQNAIQNNKENLLTLPHNTILCPGHGPMTTVAQELTNNPFF